MDLKKGKYKVNVSYGGNKNYTGNNTTQKLTIKEEEKVVASQPTSSSDTYVERSDGTLTYGYKDVGIVPAEISYVKSRSECNPYYGFFGGKQNILPLFASPMSSVISDNNYETFEEHGITSIIPRNIPFEKRKELLFKGAWTGFSLSEFEELFCNEETYEKLPIMEYRVCIDIANGEMACLYDICKKAKKMSLGRAYVLTIMTGNIGNPATYNWIRRLNNGF